MDKVIPNTFILGFPKCGTTLCRDLFYQHPDIFMSKPEEPGYFDRRFRFNSDKLVQFQTLEDYLTVFSRVTHERVVVDGSVYQVYDREYIKEILRISPEAKFIIFLRNPIRASNSMYLENCKYSGPQKEPKSSFEVAWFDRVKGIAADIPSQFSSRKYDYPWMYDYYERIKEVEDLLSDRVHYVKFEDFVNDRNNSVDSLFQFLKLTRPLNISFRHVNKARTSRGGLMRLVWGVVNLIKHWPLLKDFRGRGLTNNNFFMSVAKKEQLGHDLQKDIDKRLLGNLTQLEGVVNLDLSSWKSDF
jgi:hypothetical protein